MNSVEHAADRQAALAFLRRDVMGNLPMLKMLSAYPTQAALHFREREGRAAAMLMLPVAGLVTTAAHDLFGRGLTARYQTTEDNDASQAVAQASGFVPFLTLEHWLGTGQ